MIFLAKSFMPNFHRPCGDCGLYSFFFDVSASSLERTTFAALVDLHAREGRQLLFPIYCSLEHIQTVHPSRPPHINVRRTMPTITAMFSGLTRSVDMEGAIVTVTYSRYVSSGRSRKVTFAWTEY